MLRGERRGWSLVSRRRRHRKPCTPQRAPRTGEVATVTHNTHLFDPLTNQEQFGRTPPDRRVFADFGDLLVFWIYNYAKSLTL